MKSVIITGFSVVFICMANIVAFAGSVNIQGYHSELTVTDQGVLLALSGDGDIIERASTTGEEFVSVYQSIGSDHFNNIHAANTTIIAVGVDGLILQSVDEGITWSLAIAPAILGELAAVSSDGNSHWVAAGNSGNGGVILRSSDNGANWSTASSSPDTLLNDVLFDPVGQRWIAAGGDVFDGHIYQSTDEGDSWSELPLPAGTGILNAVAVDDSGSILAVGEWGSAVLWTDSETGFITIGENLVSENLHAVASSSPGNWIIGGDQGVLLSVNGESVSISQRPNPALNAISDIVISGQDYLIAGKFPEPIPEHNITLKIVSWDIPNNEVQIELVGGVPGVFYLLEESFDLSVWQIVTSSNREQAEEPLLWTVSLTGNTHFWRVKAF